MAASLLFHLWKDRALVFSYQTWTKQHKRQRILCEWLLSLLVPEMPTSSSYLPNLAFKTHLRENLPVEFSWENEILFQASMFPQLLGNTSVITPVILTFNHLCLCVCLLTSIELTQVRGWESHFCYFWYPAQHLAYSVFNTSLMNGQMEWWGDEWQKSASF